MNRWIRRTRLVLLPILLFAAIPARAGEERAPLTVLAAASLTDVLPKVGEAWTAQSGVPVRFTFDASSRLAKQVEAGMGADLFISADLDWMDYLQQRNLVASATRLSLLGNRLVLVIPASSSLPITDARGLALPEVKHLALAAESVPAGRYGRAALSWAGVSKDVEPKIVSGDSVRVVLGWVARGEADAGIVYATDVRAAPKVKAVYTFPVTAHAPIVYPAAVLTSSTEAEQARIFLAFCKSAAGRALFEAAGFTWLADVL